MSAPRSTPPASGTVVAIEDRPVPHPSGLSAPCVVIETDGEESWADLPEPLTDYEYLDPAVLRERIRACGVVGLGGASFPTSVKVNPGKDHPIHTLIINAAECEPYITCDDLLMRERSGDILQGIRILLHLLGAKQCLIGIEDNKPQAIESMRLARAESDIKDRVEIVVIPTLYPSGGEKQLIKVLTGREVPSHGIPAQIGIVCQNVGTTAAVADAVLLGKPLIERYVTVTGRGVTRPSNLNVRVGTPAADLIAQCGGLTRDLRKLVCGGPMMGFDDRPGHPDHQGRQLPAGPDPRRVPGPGSRTALHPLRALCRCLPGQSAASAALLVCPRQGPRPCPGLQPLRLHRVRLLRPCLPLPHSVGAVLPLCEDGKLGPEQEKKKADHAKARHTAKLERQERLERERQAKLRAKKEAVKEKPAPAAQGGGRLGPQEGSHRGRQGSGPRPRRWPWPSRG